MTPYWPSAGGSIALPLQCRSTWDLEVEAAVQSQLLLSFALLLNHGSCFLSSHCPNSPFLAVLSLFIELVPAFILITTLAWMVHLNLQAVSKLERIKAKSSKRPF